jgi:soluble lytic murein transglycosylase-like protein
MERYAMILPTLLLIATLSQNINPIALQEVIEKRAFVLKTDLEPYDSEQIALTTLEVSKEFNLDISLILAIIELESRYEKRAKSKKGCLGLTQVSKRTGKYIANKFDIKTYSLTTIKDGILIGVAYLKELLIQFKTLPAAITIYNKGIVQWLDNPKTSGYAKKVIKRAKYLKSLIRKENNEITCFNVDKERKK